MVSVAGKAEGFAGVSCEMINMSDHKILDYSGVMGIPFWSGFAEIGKGEPHGDQVGTSRAFCILRGAAPLRRSASYYSVFEIPFKSDYEM